MDVVNKVRKHPMYVDRPPDSQKSLADDLVDPLKIKERFAHLLDVDQIVSNIRDSDDCELTHSMEINNRRKMQKRDAALASSLPVKLYLSRLQHGPPLALAERLTNLLRFAFGPLHAGLVVGNISIDWNDKSLVIPLPAPDIPGQFQAHVDDEGAWDQRRGELVNFMSIANRKNMGTPHKLEIIYKSRAEKEKLLEDLVDVIVNYNKSKKYSVFTCNCQDFVRDALRALQLRDVPTFEGNLGSYLQALKEGQVTADLQFDTHPELDSYVKANVKTLTKRDKEYLLCLYFQFHSIELGELNPEEQEEWVCPIESCQCGELEHHIENESLFFHQFRGTATAGPVSATPTLLTVPEEVLDNIVEGGWIELPDNHSMDSAVPDELLNGETKEDQQLRLSRYSGYSTRVLSKLRGHPKYRDMSEKKLQLECENLSEKEAFRKVYFSEYIDKTSEILVLETCKEQSEAESLPPRELQRRASDRFERLFTVKMKLIIRAPARIGVKKAVAKAPVLLALQVGDYIFEWNETSLVIPIELKQVEAEPLLFSPVLQQSEWWCNFVEREKANIQQSIQEVVQHNDYSMQIQLQYDLTQKKDKLLFAFIETVVRFNRDLQYHTRRCNNQTFLTEAMKSLGIKRPAKLSSSIQQFIDQLKPSRTISRKQIRDHGELDTVAVEVIDGEGEPLRRDVEYLIAKYFLFHVSGWEGEQEQGGERLSNRWSCSIPECKLLELEKILEELTHISST